MFPDIITNLTEEELRHELDSFMEVCDECEVIHQAFCIHTPCKECQNRPLVNGLKRHFQIM